MVEYPEALTLMQSGDGGLLSTVIMAAAFVFSLMYLSYRVPSFRAVCQRYGAAALPVLTLPINPILGLFAGIAAWLPRRVALPTGMSLVKLSIAAGALLRFPLMFDSLWYDEAFTAQMVGLDSSQWIGAVMSDVHPPLFYLLLGLWRLLAGDSPFMLRLPAYIHSLASIYLIYRAAKAMGMRERAAGIAALLVATLPASIYYGAEARSYALLTMLVLIGLIAVLERRSWLTGVIVAALCFTHNAGFLYAGILAAGGILYHWRDRHFLVAPIVGLCAGAAWLPILLKQSQFLSDGDGYWTHFELGTVFWTLTKMTIGVVGESFDLLLVFPVVGITAAALWYLRHWLRTKPGVLWVALSFGVPMVMAALSLVWTPIYVFRHFLPSMMLLMVAWAYILDRSQVAMQIIASTIAIAVVALYVYGAPSARPDYRTMISESCDGASSLYSTSINGAFILLQNDSRPVLTWVGALDNGRTVEQSNLVNFNIATGSISDLSGTVCVMQIDVPLSHQSERSYVDLLLLTTPHSTRHYHLATWNDIYFHLLEA